MAHDDLLLRERKEGPVRLINPPVGGGGGGGGLESWSGNWGTDGWMDIWMDGWIHDCIDLFLLLPLLSAAVVALGGCSARSRRSGFIAIAVVVVVAIVVEVVVVAAVILSCEYR